ncbi:hypothetical protein [Georgenia sp. SYP-B2076]|uniref:hypothetical protein n=1 Tax=Georgenia sp. SYP-B2076 TaxID=2495881 RepID=UPI001F0B7E07|nr:hypothetical protein [Georgenia sp. SYP-B2076]
MPPPSSRSRLSGTDGVVYPSRADGVLDFEPVRRDLPVYAGAINRKMLALSGR